MSIAHPEDKLSKPITLTIAAVLLAIPIQPILGVDLIYDVLAVCIVGSKWLQYYRDAFAIAQSVNPAKFKNNAPSGKSISCTKSGMEFYERRMWPEAMKQFQMAAGHNNTMAMCYIGMMYKDGDGVNRNIESSLEWFNKALALGETELASANIGAVGVLYLEGDGVPKDPKKAAELVAVAARLGAAGSQHLMGSLYRRGIGVPQDFVQARYWYGLAAAQGDEDAQRKMAEMDEQARQQKGSSSGAREGGPMTRAAALEILDLKEGASPAEIKAAYTRLMQQVHPDKGGSTFFAKQLNEARQILLRK